MLSRQDLRYSQNFLHSRGVVDALLNRTGIGRDDLVLDIGAGRGIITASLADRCRRVIAIEKDPTLAEALQRRFARSRNVVVRPVDFLTDRLPGQRFKVFANLPFTITAQAIAKLTAPPYPSTEMYLAVQREAAARYTGAPTGSLRSTLLRPWYEPAVIHRFQRTDFVPVPQVDIVMLRLSKRGPPPVVGAHPDLYRDFVTACFTSRRPYLRDTLKQLMGLAEVKRAFQRSGLKVNITPRDVPYEAWLDLFEMFLVAERPPSYVPFKALIGSSKIQQRSLTRKSTAPGWRAALQGEEPHEWAPGLQEERNAGSIPRRPDS